MSFLTAEWRKLAIANYVIDPSILKKYLPYKTELDLWDGKCHVSLIGFMFQNTKLLGIKVPFHSNFEEVNLRFYVKHKRGSEWERGVVFIKEFVPKPAVTFIANTFYGEHYQTVAMHHDWATMARTVEVAYHWEVNNVKHNIKIIANSRLDDIIPACEAEFITEHYWGYTKITDNKTSEYEVIHPRWQTYDVISYDIDVDFERLYGNDFASLNQKKPDSVILAEGSIISIEHKKPIV